MKTKAIVIALILGLFAFWGCKTGTEPKNEAPVISSLTAEPSSVEIGGTSILTCVAIDDDGDELTYTWEESSGSISGTGSSVTWLAPNTEGTYSVSCTVDDGNGGQDIESVNISVESDDGSFSVPFSDNYSSYVGFTNETYGDYTISGGQLSWNADRGIDQDFYIPIEQYSGNFTLTVKHNVTNFQSNCWIEIGLVSNVDGFSSNASYPESGVILNVGWTGGGTEFSVPYIRPTVRYTDGTSWSPSIGDVNPGGAGPDTTGFISYSNNLWYQSVMSVNSNTVNLKVYDDSETLVGERNWIFTSSTFNFNYIYIGNGDTEDWPEGNGYLDDLEISN